MLTIDEYIAKMKRVNKLDEFDYTKLSENMTNVIKYVMDYFNEYLTMEAVDAQTLKLKYAYDALEKEVSNKYPMSKDFIVNFYSEHRIRIHTILHNWTKDVPYLSLYYSKSDFADLAIDFCDSNNIKNIDFHPLQTEIATLISEVKKNNTENVDHSDLIHLDCNLVKWIRDTYQLYGVNLCSYAWEVASSYYEKYVKYVRGSYTSPSYYINNYNHRYNIDPFEIDSIYEANKHRPFLENKRGELEMLFMHNWLFTQVYDENYWPEYVNLCVSHGRVNLAKYVNPLISVTSKELSYPDDIPCWTEYIISEDGTLKKNSKSNYILRIDPPIKSQNIWTDLDKMNSLITVLHSTFKECGIPNVLEFSSPLKTELFKEDDFFSCCSLLEKKMKKFTSLKIAFANVSTDKKTKLKGYISATEDIIRFKYELRKYKLHFYLSIDFPLLLTSKRRYGYNQDSSFKLLTEIKNSILCIHTTNIAPNVTTDQKMRDIASDTPVYQSQKYQYPGYHDFYAMLSVMFYDNQPRYFVPKDISNDSDLEFAVDNFLRSGFAFCAQGDFNE